MEYESACDEIRGNIESLLFGLGRPATRATFVAARATREISDALHHASGNPEDPRWYEALTSLEEFVDVCAVSPRVARSRALAQLRDFVVENGGALRQAQDNTVFGAASA